MRRSQEHHRVDISQDALHCLLTLQIRCGDSLIKVQKADISSDTYARLINPYFMCANELEEDILRQMGPNTRVVW